MNVLIFLGYFIHYFNWYSNIALRLFNCLNIFCVHIPYGFPFNTLMLFKKEEGRHITMILHWLLFGCVVAYQWWLQWFLTTFHDGCRERQETCKKIESNEHNVCTINHKSCGIRVLATLDMAIWTIFLDFVCQYFFFLFFSFLIDFIPFIDSKLCSNYLLISAISIFFFVWPGHSSHSIILFLRDGAIRKEIQRIV